MEEKKKMNLDEMKKAKMPLNNEEMSMVSGAGMGFGWYQVIRNVLIAPEQR
mgnify:CR=1 FL=1